MNKLQLHISKLLKEVASICETYDIKYYLSGKALKGAIEREEFFEDNYECHVLMTADDAQRFIDVVNKQDRKERAIEYLVDNPHYGEYSFKYVDAGTMYLDLDANDADIYRGLFIKVNILRHRLATKEMRNYSQALENMCEGKAVDRGRIGTLTALKLFFRKLFQREMFYEKAFYELTELYSKGKNGDYLLPDRTGKLVRIDAEAFEQQTDVNFCGNEIKAMGNIELYMEKYFGINDEVSPTKSEKIWASIDYSYSDFIDKCDERGVSIDDIMKENNTYKKRENALLRYNDEIEGYAHDAEVLFKTQDFIDRCTQDKRRIENIYAQSDYESLVGILTQNAGGDLEKIDYESVLVRDEHLADIFENALYYSLQQ